jgi:GTPase Era involved in 16S rRNA processing
MRLLTIGILLKKFLLLNQIGLDNAGKTTILKRIMGEDISQM